MEPLKCTDLSYLRKLSNGSNEFVEQMVSLFIEQTPVAIGQMENAYKLHDWNNLRAVAHKMKPSFGFMGIEALKGLIAELEDDAEKGQNEKEMGEKISRVREVCTQAIAELQAEVKAER